MRPDEGGDQKEGPEALAISADPLGPVNSMYAAELRQIEEHAPP
jgi:hypothetical protein